MMKSILVITLVIFISGCSVSFLQPQSQAVSCEKGKSQLLVLDREELKAEDSALIGDESIKPNAAILDKENISPLEYLSSIRSQKAELKRKCNF